MEIRTRPGLCDIKLKCNPGADIRFHLLLFLFSATKAHGYLVTESTAKKMIKGENMKTCLILLFYFFRYIL